MISWAILGLFQPSYYMVWWAGFLHLAPAIAVFKVAEADRDRKQQLYEIVRYLESIYATLWTPLLSICVYSGCTLLSLSHLY